MFKRSIICLVIISILMLSGCLIKGRVVDGSGVGLKGVTVFLFQQASTSGQPLLITSTDSKGDYQFGSLDGMLSANDYTIQPGIDGYSFIPEKITVTLFTIPAEDENKEDVVLPVSGVDFVAVKEGGLYPDIRGKYTGSYTVDVTSCMDAGDNGIYEGTLVININSQSEENFSGSATGTLVFEAGAHAQENIQLSGTITESGEISGTTSHTFYFTSGEGTFSGWLNDDILTIVNSGHDNSGDTCSYTKYMTATR